MLNEAPDAQLAFTDSAGNAFAPQASPSSRKPKPQFDAAWWERLTFAMSNIALDPDGTPIPIICEWLKAWDIQVNRKELLDALVGLGYPTAIKLKGNRTGAAWWVVRPLSGQRRTPALRPTHP